VALATLGARQPGPKVLCRAPTGGRRAGGPAIATKNGSAVVVKRLWGWGLGAVLALGLAACGDSPAEINRPLEPGGGFKAEALGDVSATLKIPDTVSPSAALIQADLSLQSKASDVEVVTVPRSCDIYDWVIRDTAGKLVMTKDPVECVEQATTKALAPGSI